MTGQQQENAMVHYALKIRRDQKDYLDKFKAEAGNPAQLIRMALDKLIEEKGKKE